LLAISLCLVCALTIHDVKINIGYLFQNGSLKARNNKPQRPFVESFEKIPLLTAATTFIGFYLMLLMGYVSSLLFTPKVAQERNRKVFFFSINAHNYLIINFLFKGVRSTL